MHNFSVKTYKAKDLKLWNNFVAKAKNATFLFNRHFMDYHSDRFIDYSLLVFKAELLVAVIPANKLDKTLQSHQGLTYGGFITDKSLKISDAINAFKAVLEFLDTNNIVVFNIKLIPSIYTQYPSGEIEYLCFLLQGTLTRRDVLSVIDNSVEKIKSSTLRKRGVKKAATHNLIIKEEIVFDSFWNSILVPNLKNKFNKNPVHSLEEIILLKNKFPNNIRQFNVYKGNKLIAGTTIFETKHVAHVQYISANESKQELGSLDFLFQHLIHFVFKDKGYFDFGISNENNGKSLNEGLLYWKESFGARTITQDFYSITVKNHKFLNTVML